MKAVVVKRYGAPEVAVIEDRPEPSIKSNELLVRIEAVAVTAGDDRIRAARFPHGFAVPARLALGIRGPRRQVLGSAFSGVIEKVGSAVDGFTPGEEVAGMNGVRMGAHAQLAAIRSTSITHKPAGVSHIDAAGVLFGGTTALRFLRGRVHPGSKVLVNGASGAVGTSAVQLAALAGAEVTAVTSSANAPLASRLGAVHVVDYRTQQLDTLPSGFDLVFDAVGNIDRSLGLQLAAADGFAVLAVASLWDTARASARVITGPAQESASDMAHLLGLIEEGQLDPMTTSFGGLSAIVEAYKLVDSGRKVGNVVVQPWA
ncbi:NAD(P)-dependent alcohol dehydrogenase [Rhodococcus zopfii]|uniref:NAD(P)-dependent alcohol dehydrogenase n=1 Tax=Rhodococcus zopfii TaxID=43772 RepID=A0ABU3WK56_9NOCA|nr:NAD(P)-dependent alcohol dehydrogenase [Rhodococcus zopfii]